MDDIEPQHKMIKDSPLGTNIHLKFKYHNMKANYKDILSIFFLHRPVVCTLLRRKMVVK